MFTITAYNTFKIISVTLIALGAIMLIPLEEVLLRIQFSEFSSVYIGLAIKMSIIFLIGYQIIKKNKLNPIAGLSTTYKWKNKLFNIIPFYLFILGIVSVSSKDFSEIEIFNVLILLLGCFAVGFAEEFLFRGVIQSLLLKKFAKTNNGIFKAVLSAALIFGFFHLLNLFKNDNIVAVVVQVVYATFIGFFFGVLVLKTNKLIPLAITHALINFFFSLQFLPGFNTLQNNAPEETSITAIIIFLPLFIVGLTTLKKLNNDTVLEKINTRF